MKPADFIHHEDAASLRKLENIPGSSWPYCCKQNPSDAVYCPKCGKEILKCNQCNYYIFEMGGIIMNISFIELGFH